MITTNMAILFIIIVFALFWYVFRAMKAEDHNPAWGDLLASAVSTILCAMLAYSFINGYVMDMSIVQNSTYQVTFSNTTNPGLVYNITSNLTSRQYVLGKEGAGMYTISAIESDTKLTPYLQNFTVTKYTHDIVYLQIQDWFLFFLFLLLTIISLIMFGYILWKVISNLLFGEQEKAMAAQKDEEAQG